MVGTFQHLNPFAQPNALRIICVNRREYPGSSSYNPTELKTFAEGTEAERTALLEQQGRDLAMFLDGILELSIPQAGGIVLIGWSIGTIYLLALIACVKTLPTATQERLSCVRGVIMFRSSIDAVHLLEC